MSHGGSSRILEEIVWTDLNTLLSTTTQQEFTLNLPEIDALLAAAYKVRTRRRVLELLGLGPCTGKTTLLYLLVGLATLPVSLGGKGACAVLLDCSGRFDVVRLRNVVSEFAKLGDTGDVEVGHVVGEALEHVHVFRPDTVGEFIATVGGLEEYFLDRKGNGSSGRELAGVFVDGVEGFVWEGLREGPTDGNTEAYTTIIQSLQSLQKTFLQAPIIATNNGTIRSSPDGEAPIYKTYLPQVWTAFVGVRIILVRAPVKPFPVEVSLQKAWMEQQERRLEVVRRNRIEGWVDVGGLGGGVESEIGRLKGGGRFSFSLGAGGGVTFEQ
ncbi:hypothetical protein HOY82DRAFT_150121 [Tuber indicum]|nr:hypothetical protein HOY82DRAFT_150121 [Tuber indicum]